MRRYKKVESLKVKGHKVRSERGEVGNKKRRLYDFQTFDFQTIKSLYLRTFKIELIVICIFYDDEGRNRN
ncbi:hypothetical protein OA93_01130 [Flavobacterium sp. KMS]|nr:hypothetical protein OA93_01130 [Flavobacterium sp. KMS]KIC02916.1 hypothetical protein OA88_06395 [Flavobacterium sp. JRM]